jgi:hypothetical protein
LEIAGLEIFVVAFSTARAWPGTDNIDKAIIEIVTNVIFLFFISVVLQVNFLCAPEGMRISKLLNN